MKLEHILTSNFCKNNPQIKILLDNSTEYRQRDSVEYVCPEHGSVITTIGSLIKSKGCKHCSYRNAGLARHKSSDDISSLFKIELPNYRFIKATRHNGEAAGIVECPTCTKHFTILCYNVQSGNTKNPCNCDKIPHNKRSLKEVQDMHSSALKGREISIVEYIDAHNTIFSCGVCSNTWKSSINHVVTGFTSCPHCTTQLREYYVYLLYSSSLEIYKIGIANTVQARVARINSNNNTDFYEVFSAKFANKPLAYSKEQFLHSKFKLQRFTDFDSTEFDGKTELFRLELSDVEEIKQYLTESPKVTSL